jgi:phosphohistidine phosphatase
MPSEGNAGGPPKTRPAYELYLMRHGVTTAQEGEVTANDFKRPLTPGGRERVREIGKGLKRLGASPEWIVTSPFVRALQTAETVAEVYGPGVPLNTLESLRPGGSAEELLSHLIAQPNRRRVLVIGHEPDLSLLARRLIGASPQANLTLKRGGCCSIIFDHFPPRSPGQLAWWLTPRLLRKLA